MCKLTNLKSHRGTPAPRIGYAPGDEKARDKQRRKVNCLHLKLRGSTGGLNGCVSDYLGKQEMPDEARSRHREGYPLPMLIEKLRRLADALERGKRFDIQIAGERISIPAHAIYNIEHEREEGEEEIEFQIKGSARGA